MDHSHINKIIFGGEKATTSAIARKKMKLSSNFNGSSQQVFGSQLEVSAPEVASSNAPEVTNINTASVQGDMLGRLFDKLCSLEVRLDKIEDNMVPKTDVLAHHKTMREGKVLTKKVHHIVCKMSGETGDDLHTEIKDSMPLMSVDALFDLEEKLKEKSYEDAVASYLYILKGKNGELEEVLKRVLSDELLELFNWDGRGNKKALSKLVLVDKVLYDIFKLEGRISFEKRVKKAVELSHHRIKQRRYQHKLNLTI